MPVFEGMIKDQYKIKYAMKNVFCVRGDFLYAKFLLIGYLTQFAMHEKFTPLAVQHNLS